MPMSAIFLSANAHVADEGLHPRAIDDPPIFDQGVERHGCRLEDAVSRSLRILMFVTRASGVNRIYKPMGLAKTIDHLD
jgi:hypothetical protein